MSTMEFKPFPKIANERGVVRNIRRDGLVRPRRYAVTVKTHGTNAALAFKQGVLQHVQSRNRIITPEDDNFGFANAVLNYKQTKVLSGRHLISLYDWIAYCVPKSIDCYIYGEWAGPGISKGTALNDIDARVFIPFATYACPDEHKPWLCGWNRILPALEFFELPADCNLEKFVALADEIAEQCPVAKEFFGIEAMGEGIVCYPDCVEGMQNPELWFKIKGQAYREKHQNKVSPVSTGPKVDPALVAFVNEQLHGERLRGCLAVLEEQYGHTGSKITREFMDLCIQDLLVEEAGTIEERGFEPAAVGKLAGTLAAKWYNGGRTWYNGGADL
jgi:hypothetical protein